MKQIRWKSKYLTGNLDIDTRLRSIVDILNAVTSEANNAEHCVDLSSFTAEAISATENMLSSVSASPERSTSTMSAFENELRNLLTSKLPLDARGTSACNNCGMCGLLEKQSREWLGDEFTDQAKSR